MRARLILPLGGIGLAVTAATLAAQVPPPFAGRALFQARCAGCHNDGAFGTKVLSRRANPAVLDQRQDLNAVMVRIVVRRGIGQMPAIRRAELGDAELDSIAAYLQKEQSK